MSNASHSAVRMVSEIVLAISAVCLYIAPEPAAAEGVPRRIEADGTLNVSELTIPPSDLWSTEFKKYYVEMLANTEFGWVPTPARDAPKTEWDKFDAWVDDHYYAKPLSRVLKQYPVKVVDTKIADVRVGIITPSDGIAPENLRRVLINLHGGAFVYNRGLSLGQLDSIPVASIGRIKVITVDYRQAPFSGYPAATEDVEAVYKELLKDYEPGAIGIYGCSAGGALVAQATAWLQAKKLPRPGAIGIFCFAPPKSAPLFDAVGDSAIWYTSFPKNLSAPERAAPNPGLWYMGGAASNDPKAYPGLSEDVLAKFPPTLLLSGTRDAFMSEVVVAHARFLKLGVESSLYIMEGAPHMAHVMAVGTPEAHDAQAYVAHWFQQHLAK